MRAFLCNIAFVLLASIGALLAIEPQIEAVVSSSTAAVGEPLEFQVVITMDLKSRTPDLTRPQFPSDLPFRVQEYRPYPQRLQSIAIINGRKEDNSRLTITCPYLLIPQKSGTHAIPALTYVVDGRKLTTQPITLTITERPSNDSATTGVTITQTFSPARCVPGKMVRARWEITVPQNRNILRIVPELPLAELSRHFKLTESLEDPQWHEGRRIINGIPCSTYSCESQLRPLAEGRIVIPGANVTAVVRVQDERRQSRRSSPFDDDDFFGSFFDRGYSTRNISAVADDTELVVEPLPAAGRPDNFSGLLGPLTATAEAEPADVSVGDPILFKITLQGKNISSDNALPDLKGFDALSQSFRISGDDPGIANGEAITFQRTLRATNDRVTEIPSLEIPYYDTEREEYAIAKTTAIPLAVSAAKQITLADASGNGVSGNNAQAAAAATKSEEASAAMPAQDLRPNHDSTAIALSISPRDNPLRRPIMAMLILLPPSLWLVLALAKALASWRRRDPQSRASRNAKALFRRELSAIKAESPDCAGRLYDALQKYMATRYRLNSRNITARELQGLASIPDSQRDMLTQLLTQCENAKFAGGNIDLTSFRRQAKALD